MMVAICIATRDRPQQLAELLDALIALPNESSVPDRCIVVVDNDPAHGARDVITARMAQQQIPIIMGHAPRPGLAAVRNATLDLVPDDAQWIAFIDDDEIPDQHWLARLFQTQQKTNADVVTGPVERTVPEDAPDWVREGNFFARIQRTTGTACPYAYTNNALVRRACITEHNIRFDARDDRTGGEDVRFFTAMRDLGCSIVWCDEAIVREPVAIDRCNAQWIIRRARRIGANMARLQCQRQGWMRGTLMMWRSAINKIPTGLWTLGTRGWTSKASRVEGRRLIALGFGHLLGPLGMRPRGYG